MRITEHSLGRVVVLDVEGCMTAENLERPLVAAVRRLVDAGNVNILVNLEHVRRIDSAGLAELVDGYNAATGRGGQFTLEYVTPGVRAILHETQLDAVFAICSEEAQALATFSHAA